MQTVDNRRPIGHQSGTSAETVMVIVGETTHSAESTAMSQTDGRNGTDHVSAVPLNMVQRRLWWQRNRLVVRTERPGYAGSQ